MTSIIARIERIREGHSERALIHAVGADGHEYKIEVPPNEIRMLTPGQSYTLVLSWSIHVSPVSVATADQGAVSRPEASSPASSAASASSAVAASPRSVDAQFMALMNRASPSAVQASEPPHLSTPDQQLASLLRVPSDTSKPAT